MATDGPTQDERTYAMLAHLLAFTGYVIPFGNIIAPLVVWQVKKDQSAYVTAHAKESLNFQISVTIYFVIALVLVLVLIGIPLLVGLGLFDLVLVIIAAIRANDGQPYRYPLCIRLIA